MQNVCFVLESIFCFAKKNETILSTFFKGNIASKKTKRTPCYHLSIINNDAAKKIMLRIDKKKMNFLKKKILHPISLFLKK